MIYIWILLLVIITGYAAAEVMRFFAAARRNDVTIFPYPIERLRRRMMINSLMFLSIVGLLFFSFGYESIVLILAIMLALLGAAGITIKDISETLSARRRSRIRLAKNMIKEFKNTLRDFDNH